MPARLTYLLIWLLAIASPPLIAATQIQSPASISAAADAYLQALYEDEKYPPSISVVAPDSRLRLPFCTQPLVVNVPNIRRQGGRLSVSVQCPEPKTPWSLYVSADLKIQKEILVTARPILRGQPLTRADIKLALRDISRLHGQYLQDIDTAIGQVTRTPLAAGSPLVPRLLEEPVLITRGDTVRLRLRGGGIEIYANGQALSNAKQGQRVRIRNNNSGRVVQGIAKNKGLVEVIF